MFRSKTCSTCRQLLPLEAFTRRKDSRDGRQNRCRACWHEWDLANRPQHIADVQRRNALRTQENRRRLIEYLQSHPCTDCGESDLRVLDFDHRDRENKRGVVSRLVFRVGWARLEQEIALCDVRCANCHRRRTAQQLGYWSAVPAAEPSGSGITSPAGHALPPYVHDVGAAATGVTLDRSSPP